jgi:hypothetical protein
MLCPNVGIKSVTKAQQHQILRSQRITRIANTAGKWHQRHPVYRKNKLTPCLRNCCSSPDTYFSIYFYTPTLSSSMTRRSTWNNVTMVCLLPHVFNQFILKRMNRATH